VPVVLPDTCQEAVEVAAGELPVEGPGGRVVVLLEGEDLTGELIEVLEVVGGQELSDAALVPHPRQQHIRHVEAGIGILLLSGG
jgi:hypothetical protein